MRTVPAVLLAGLAAASGPCWAGALQDCAGETRVVRCLEYAKQQATEQMLERFLEVKEALTALGGRRAEQADDALKQSQRAFERYLADHCNGLESMLGDGSAAGLACETDLLRERAKTLEAIDLGKQRRL